MNAIHLRGVVKAYLPPSSQMAFVKAVLLGQKTKILGRPVFEVPELLIDSGEVLGIIGVNGAGKSTFLKLISKTLAPTKGVIEVRGKLCALLELGAGFHPEMTGRENILLGGLVAGLSQEEVSGLYQSIVDFSGLERAIESPIKTYSSGMAMRLAFSIATAVDPDILILDETLSVGDGRFAKKSFDRIMDFRKRGKTILFCSHSMYHVQAIASRVLWIEGGRIHMDGDPATVISAYTDFLTQQGSEDGLTMDGASSSQSDNSMSRIQRVTVSSDDLSGTKLLVQSGLSQIRVNAEVVVSKDDLLPTLACIITDGSGRAVTSASTRNDHFDWSFAINGQASVELCFPKISLLQGSYWVHFYLLCEDGMHILDQARMVAELTVIQETLEQGIVRLPHEWSQPMISP